MARTRGAQVSQAPPTVGEEQIEGPMDMGPAIFTYDEPEQHAAQLQAREWLNDHGEPGRASRAIR